MNRQKAIVMQLDEPVLIHGTEIKETRAPICFAVGGGEVMKYVNREKWDSVVACKCGNLPSDHPYGKNDVRACVKCKCGEYEVRDWRNGLKRRFHKRAMLKFGVTRN